MKFKLSDAFMPAEPLCNNGFRIRFGDCVYNKVGYTDASYNIVIARVLGISYAQMLAFLQSKGAVLYGKNMRYGNYYFPPDKAKEVEEICMELNRRWEQLFK